MRLMTSKPHNNRHPVKTWLTVAAGGKEWVISPRMAVWKVNIWKRSKGQNGHHSIPRKIRPNSPQDGFIKEEKGKHIGCKLWDYPYFATGSVCSTGCQDYKPSVSGRLTAASADMIAIIESHNLESRQEIFQTFYTLDTWSHQKRLCPPRLLLEPSCLSHCNGSAPWHKRPEEYMKLHPGDWTKNIRHVHRPGTQKKKTLPDINEQDNSSGWSDVTDVISRSMTKTRLKLPCVTYGCDLVFCVTWTEQHMWLLCHWVRRWYRRHDLDVHIKNKTTLNDNMFSMITIITPLCNEVMWHVCCVTWIHWHNHQYCDWS